MAAGIAPKLCSFQTKTVLEVLQPKEARPQVAFAPIAGTQWQQTKTEGHVGHFRLADLPQHDKTLARHV